MKYLTLSLCFIATLSLGSASANDTETVSSIMDKSDAYTGGVAANKRTSTLDYWTNEMIATTPAMDMPVDVGSNEIDTFALNEEAISDPTGYVPAGMAETGSDQFHKQAFSVDWATENNEFLYVDPLRDEVLNVTSDENGATFGESFVADIFNEDVAAATRNIYIDYSVNEKKALWKLYPHIWMGKLTFTTPGGNSSCSATAINKDHIVTAAHCVYETSSNNNWYRNVAFTPAYRDGSAPYGTFPAKNCRVLSSWVNHSGAYSINSWARHDVAVCKMGKNVAGKTLNQAVGWSGYGWNHNENQLHFNSGYPALDYNDIPLSGPTQYLRACTSESFKQTTDTLGSSCQYGRGISGGSWMRGYKPNYVTGSVNSVNSGLFVGKPVVYGAKFTTANIKTLCDANGC